MQPDEIDLIRHTLPKDIPVPYYADRESPRLLVLRDEFGIDRVFMDRPGTGEVLKDCGGAPVSHHTRLPAAFGFRPTAEAPAFLARVRRADLGRLRRGGGPIFRELRFGSDGAA